MSKAMQDATEPQVLRIQRSFDADPTELFACFTQADHLAKWFGPEGVSCRNVQVDAKIGGSYQLEMVNPDGSKIGLVGKFLHLEAPTSIQMTWRWVREEEVEPGEETLVTIRLSPIGSGTLLKLTHERFADGPERDNHEQGWSSSLDCLEKLLHPRSY